MARPQAVIKTTFGDITVELFDDIAPNHVKNFLDLANKGFYNGTTFHRVIPGFMIQGGCPTPKAGATGSPGTGGPGYNIDAEYNDTKHVRGVLSAARAADPNSAGCQFYVVVSDSLFLDKQYTAFGNVLSGMDAADQIVNQPRNAQDLPNERVEMTIEAL
jgi:cyclophilin family peptidyl-prolyl cis-trans isomerase